MALNITQEQYDILTTYVTSGDYIGGWAYLASIEDTYADNAYAVTSGNASNMYDTVMTILVQNHWENTAGADAYANKYEQVARQHFQQYVADIQSNPNYSLPSTEQIEESYRTAVVNAGLPPETAIDGVLTQSIPEVLDWLAPGHKAIDWPYVLGMEAERQVPSHVFDDLNKGIVWSTLLLDSIDTLSDLKALGLQEAVDWFNGVNESLVDTFRDFTFGIFDRNLGPELAQIKDYFNQAEAAIIPNCPIILDLDGDGVETAGLSNGTFFDHDGNGFAEKTAWAGADDGMLVMDLNGNGTIDTGQELFGNQTLLTDGTKAANGFLALAELDSNLDGKIDINDNGWNQLKIWSDIDADGYSASGELSTLDSLGIQSIDTGYSTSTYVDPQGNEHRQAGIFTKTDGTTGAAADVWFQTDRALSVAKDILDVPVDIAALPNLRGYGNTYDLDQAMVRDVSGELKTMVENFIAEGDPAQRNIILDQVLLKWTGSDGIDPASRGPHIDARKLGVIESFLGESFYGSAGSDPTLPIQEAGYYLNLTYQEIFEQYYAQLIGQTHLKDIMTSVAYTEFDPVTGYQRVDLSGTVTELQNQLSLDYAAGKEKLSEFARIIDGLNFRDKSNYTDFYASFAMDNEDLAWAIDSVGKEVIIGTEGNDYLDSPNPMEHALFLGGGSDTASGSEYDDAIHGGNGMDTVSGFGGIDTLRGGAGDDTLYGGTGDDILVGGTENDLLYGESGSDTYLFGLGDGQDTISEWALSGVDTDVLKFGSGITSTDLIIGRDMNNLYNVTVGINGSADMVTVENWYSDNAYKLERFDFADGTNLTGAEVEAMAVVRGTAGDDWISGSPGNEKFEGGLGNDYISGDGGSDTYLFNLGDGQDTISEGDWFGVDTDAISFGSGITNADLLIGRDMNNLYNLTIGINGTADMVTVENWYSDNAYKLERFDFADGTSLTGAEVEAMAVVRGTAGDDNIYGSYENETYEGGLGNDYIYGDGGSDTYLFNPGDGQDIIDDYDMMGSDIDTLQMGVNPLDLIFADDLAGSVNVSLNGTTDQVTVQNWYMDPAYQVEVFKAVDGSTLLNTQVDQLIQAMATFSSNNNGVTWEQGIQTMPQDVQAVISQYWAPPQP